MSQQQQTGFYAHPQQPQNVYQQMGIPQPQSHLNYPIPVQHPPIRPIKYSASNPPTSSFPNQPRPQQPQPPRTLPLQQQQPQSRPLPAPALLPTPKPPVTATASTSRPLPTPGKRMTVHFPLNTSAQNTSSSPPKRRQSPPRFTANPDSESSSPIKQSNRETKSTATPASITTSLASSSPPKPLVISPSPASSGPSTSTDGQTPKKPNPVWKRTIPEVPAPVWGYAAGLVADPHPKPSTQPPPPQVQVQKTLGGPESPTKSSGFSNKLKKKNKTKEKDGTKDQVNKLNTKTKDQVSAVYGNAYGLGYASRQAQGQKYLAHQYVGQQGPYSSPRMGPIASGAVPGYRPRDEEHDEEDEETEDVVTEEEETEEETGEEEDASDSVPTLRGLGNGHRRYYSQPLAGGAHRREEGYHGSGYDYEEEEEEEEEETPKRKFAPGGSKVPTRSVDKKLLLRPKVKTDPYGGYEDVSPIGYSARKQVRPRSEVEDVRGGRIFGAVDTMAGTNGRVFRRDESEVLVRNGKGNEDPMRSGHRRPRSAIEERELLILNARARNRNRNRNRDVESDYGAEEIHLAYDDDDDYDVTMDDRRRRRGGEELTYRPQSQPTSSSRLMGEGRATVALPRPPAMIRDHAGGPISHSQAERKIRGGPRSAFVHSVSEEEEENHDGGSTAGRWPGDLPRLPRTPGGGPGSGSGYFDAALKDSDLNLDEPPPPASIVRTPSPGVAGGYILQKREVESQNRSRSAGFEQAHNHRSEVLDDAHQRAQGQGRVYASRSGYPVPQSQAPQHQRQLARGPPHLAQQGRFTGTPSPRKQQQTPAPPPTVGIESPYPVGGRDRMADMNKLERGEREADEDNGQGQGRRTADVRNVPKVMVNDNSRRDIPTMAVSAESGRRPLPSPSSPRTRPQSMAIPHGFGGSPKKQTSSAPVPGDARETPRSRLGPGPVNSNINNNKGNNNIPAIQVFDVPGVYVSKPDFDDDGDGGEGGVMINVSGPDEGREDQNQTQQRRPALPPSAAHPNPTHPQYTPTPAGAHPVRGAAGGNNGRSLICGGCHGPITHGRILSAMGLRWHPSCFKCTVCDTLLEHVSSYENDGKAYCHLDYHETFAPRCYSCKTAIIDEQFISLDDPALGKRTYHTQHFFCAECGDPFLDPSIPLSTDANGELALSGDGEFEGFTVYKGYPYCEACHVRLRLPKCKRCKKAIRDHEQAVEALGGKWCWACFVCAGCSEPFEDPSFFQRGNQPYCENCFSIMLRNEI